jgi:hypothetical protein
MAQQSPRISALEEDVVDDIADGRLHSPACSVHEGGPWHAERLAPATAVGLRGLDLVAAGNHHGSTDDARGLRSSM